MGFFWVGFLLPTLDQAPRSSSSPGSPQLGPALTHAKESEKHGEVDGTRRLVHHHLQVVLSWVLHSHTPKRVRNKVKLMGPGVSFIIISR